MDYKEWLDTGIKNKHLIRYNKERDESLKNAKEALEQAFTPRLRKMLENNLHVK